MHNSYINNPKTQSPQSDAHISRLDELLNRNQQIYMNLKAKLNDINLSNMKINQNIDNMKPLYNFGSKSSENQLKVDDRYELEKNLKKYSAQILEKDQQNNYDTFHEDQLIYSNVYYQDYNQQKQLKNRQNNNLEISLARNILKTQNRSFIPKPLKHDSIGRAEEGSLQPLVSNKIKDNSIYMGQKTKSKKSLVSFEQVPSIKKIKQIQHKFPLQSKSSQIYQESSIHAKQDKFATFHKSNITQNTHYKQATNKIKKYNYLKENLTTDKNQNHCKNSQIDYSLLQLRRSWLDYPNKDLTFKYPPLTYIPFKYSNNQYARMNQKKYRQQNSNSNQVIKLNQRHQNQGQLNINRHQKSNTFDNADKSLSSFQQKQSKQNSKQQKNNYQCYVFVPFNKLYCSPYLQIKQNTSLVLARHSKQIQKQQKNGKIYNGVRFKFTNNKIFTDEQKLLKQIGFINLHRKYCLGIIGGINTLKKKIHIQIIAQYYNVIKQFIQEHQQKVQSKNLNNYKLSISHKQISLKNNPTVYEEQFILRNNKKQGIYKQLKENWLKAKQGIFQMLRFQNQNKKQNNKLKKVRITIIKFQILKSPIKIQNNNSNNTSKKQVNLEYLKQFQIISTNKIDQKLINHYNFSNIIFTINPLIQYYQQTKQTLQFIRQLVKKDKI